MRTGKNNTSGCQPLLEEAEVGDYIEDAVRERDIPECFEGAGETKGSDEVAAQK